MNRWGHNAEHESRPAFFVILHHHFPKYLLQMIATILMLILVPCLIALWGYFSYSYKELEQTNMVYYQENARTFSGVFYKKIDDLKLHAVRISLDSKRSGSPAAQMRQDLLTQSPIYYYTVFLKTLQLYPYTACAEWGLYYPENDVLFSGNHKYSLADYAALRLSDGEMSNDAFAAIELFFHSRDANTVFCPLYNQQGMSSLLVGFPVHLTTSNDQAMIFYRLNEASLEMQSVVPISSENNILFLMVDHEENTLLFKSGNHYFPPEIVDRLLNEETPLLSIDDIVYNVARYQNPDEAFDCLVLAPMDQVNTNTLHFYHKAKNVLIAVSSLLGIMVAVLVYINYRPIRKILTTLSIHSNDEIESIQSKFLQMQDEMSEQNQRITDFLLKNLLYGVPISGVEAFEIGITDQIQSFCVYVFDGTLCSQERKQLVHEIGSFGIVAYVTDILGENNSVVICLGAQMEGNECLTSWMESFFATQFGHCSNLRAGKYVRDINHIHESYLSCFSKEEEVETAVEPDHPVSIVADEPKYNKRLEFIKDDIEAYIKENLSDGSLSQTSVADFFGVSVYSLSRLFNQRMKVNFNDYVNSHRLEVACRLLIETDLSINDIAQQIGISNSSYFYRLFKKVYQITPNKYRERGRIALQPTPETDSDTQTE